MKLSDDNPTLNSHLYCSRCGELFRQPMRLNCGQQVHQCRHTFCADCSKFSNDKCIRCGKRILPNRVQRDILAGRLISELKVECGNSNCPWKGILEDYKFHKEKCQLQGGLENFLSRLDTMKEQTDQIVKTLSLGQLDIPEVTASSERKEGIQKLAEKENEGENSISPPNVIPALEVTQSLPSDKPDTSWAYDNEPKIKPDDTTN